MKPPPPIEIEEAEVERLIEQAEHGRLDAAAQKRILPLLRTLLWLERTLLETRISVSKLKKLLFGKRTEKSKRKPRDPPRGGAAGGGPDSEADALDPPGEDAETEPPSASSAAEQPAASGEQAPADPPRGHGRLGAAEYPGAECVWCAHETDHAGDLCPACERGRLYPLAPLVRLRFVGQPLASVRRFERERLRCALCGYLTLAELPPEAGGQTYAVSLKVTLAVAHYYLGLPFKRIEAFQALVGMPLPDATQWDLIEQVADSAYPVYEQLKRLGANQPLVYQDDTGARVLSLIKENRADPPPKRKGMYTTVLLFEGEQSICVYLSGRQHAGENLDAILAYRNPELAPIQWMSDGLAANTPKQHRDRTVDLNCLVHGRRNFVDIEGVFPEECTRVIEAIAEVYQHEAH